MHFTNRQIVGVCIVFFFTCSTNPLNSFTTSSLVTKHVSAMPEGNAPERTLITPTKLKDIDAEVNAQDDDGYTPLMVAAKNGDTDTVKFLIDAGADLNAQGADLNAHNKCNAILRLTVANKNGYMAAEENGHTDTVYYDRNYDRNTALILAVENGHTDIVKLLIDAGADLNAKNYFHDTPLIKAIYYGRIDIVKLLIDAGANLNAENLLMWAALSCRTNIVKFLIENGVNINDRDTTGYTALMVAAKNGDTNTVKFLIDAGADLNSKDKRIVLSWTTIFGRTDIEKLLIENDTTKGRLVLVLKRLKTKTLVFLKKSGNRLARFSQTKK